MTEKRRSFPVRGGSDRYASVRRKVERAREHIRQVEGAVMAFMRTRPYDIGTTRDPSTRRLTYIVRSVRETPPTLSQLAGDAFHNLRSALDHLANQLVIAAGNVPDEHTAFPIYDTKEGYEGFSRGRVAGMRADAVRAIDALLPYRAGNDALWRLHRLNIIDKHRDWLVVGSRLRAVDIMPVIRRDFVKDVPDEELARSAQAAMAEVSLWLRPAQDSLEPLKPGDELLTDSPDAPEDPSIRFAFDVAILEPDVAEGEPLIAVLHRTAELVEHVVYTLAPHLT